MLCKAHKIHKSKNTLCIKSLLPLQYPSIDQDERTWKKSSTKGYQQTSKKLAKNTSPYKTSGKREFFVHKLNIIVSKQYEPCYQQFTSFLTITKTGLEFVFQTGKKTVKKQVLEN